MGRMSRDKGKRGEREVIACMRPVLDRIAAMYGDAFAIDMKRNTMQSDRGGFDLHGIEFLAIEVKRQERLCIKQWWRQACGQANARQIPVLIWRQSHRPWCVRVRDARGDRDMNMEDFLSWLEQHLIADCMDRGAEQLPT